MADLIDEVILRETGGKPNGGYTNDPLDAGGRTIWGISERGNPDLWRNGPPTYAQARQRYFERYVAPFQGIEDPVLLHQLVDWGVTSGPKRAIQSLQQVVGAAVDGVLGPQSLKKVNGFPAGTLYGEPATGRQRLNVLMTNARIMQYAGATKAKPTNLRFILGWLKRAMEFL